MEYRFMQWYSDPTPYSTPTSGKIQADTYQQAIQHFCRLHGFKVLEIERDLFWCEDEHGAMMQFSVSW